MNITIERGICWVYSDAVPGWVATCPGIVIYRSWATPCYSVRGEGESPTEALGDLLLKCLEEGDRDPELLAMIDAEFAGHEWWQEMKAIEAAEYLAAEKAVERKGRLL
jgi:hypothetical protein